MGLRGTTQIAMQSPSWCAPDCQETATATECCVATGGKLGLATGTEAEIPAASRTEASRYSMRARGLAASQTSASRPIADLLHLPAKPRHVLSITSAPAFFCRYCFLSLIFLSLFITLPSMSCTRRSRRFIDISLLVVVLVFVLFCFFVLFFIIPGVRLFAFPDFEMHFLWAVVKCFISGR